MQGDPGFCLLSAWSAVTGHQVSTNEEGRGAANDWLHLEEGAPTRLQQPQQRRKQLSLRLTGLASHLISSIKVDEAALRFYSRVLMEEETRERGAASISPCS